MTNEVTAALSIIALLVLAAAIALYLLNVLIGKFTDRLIESDKCGFERRRMPKSR